MRNDLEGGKCLDTPPPLLFLSPAVVTTRRCEGVWFIHLGNMEVLRGAPAAGRKVSRFCPIGSVVIPRL